MHNTKYSMYDYCFLKACEWNSEYYEYYVIALLIHVSLQSRRLDLLLKILTLEAFVLIHIYFGLFTTRLLDVSTMNHSIILIINNQGMPFLLKSLFFPVGIVYIFFKIIIFLIWHPCVVYNRNNSPERGVSPEGVARGRHSSRGGVIPVVHHTGMSYLFYYTEQHTKHKRGKIDKHQRFWINTLLLKIYKLQ